MAIRGSNDSCMKGKNKRRWLFVDPSNIEELVYLNIFSQPIVHLKMCSFLYNVVKMLRVHVEII